MTNQDNIVQLKEELILLYVKYFGSIMAEGYKEFYSDKDVETVLLSAKELLTEYAGETKARELIEQLKTKYKIATN